MDSYHERKFEQQKAIRDICRELGLVPFYPDYHGTTGDTNTVLIYTMEDSEFNKKVDKKLVQYSSSETCYLHFAVPEECVYRDAVFVLQNTDVNGRLNYCFFNYGKIDLRPLNWRDSLRKAIESAYELYKSKGE